MRSRTALAVLLVIFVLMSAFPLCLYAEENTSYTLSREGALTVLDFDGAANTGMLVPSGIDGADAEQKTSCRQYEITEDGYYKFTSTESSSDGQSFSNCYIDFIFENGIVFGIADYVVFSLSFGTENSFIVSDTGEGVQCLSFMGENGIIDLYIAKLGEEWVLTDRSNPSREEATVFANLGSVADGGAWFDLKLVVELSKSSDGISPRYHLYVDGSLAFSGEADGQEAESYFDRIRLSFSSLDLDDSDQALNEESVCLDNLKVEAVSGSSADNPCDIAYLFKDGAPTEYTEVAEWENILYSIEDGDGNITPYSEIVSTVDGSYPSVDPLRSAINSAASVSVSLKRDVIYDNECVSTVSGQTVFILPNGEYVKTVYLNGQTLAHTPYYINSSGEREAARGHFFAFSNGTGERTLNIVGGYNSAGELSSLRREASGHCMFKANSASTHTGTKITLSHLALDTKDETDTSQLTDGNLDGGSWAFTDCEINFSLSSTKFAGRSAAVDSLKFKNCKVNFTKPLTATYSNFVFEGCTLYLDSAGIEATNTTVSATVSSSRISGDGMLVSNCPEVLVVGEGVSFSSPSSLTSFENNLAAGCYLSYNKGDDAAEYPVVIRKLSLMANLTLYSDIRYNLYFPVGDVVAVDGIDVAELDTVTMEDGSAWYVYTLDFPAHEASLEKSVGFTVKSYDANTESVSEITLSKTVGITDYVSKILTNAEDKAEYTAAYTLMSDLVDYANASAVYFGASITEEFTALTSNTNYSPSSNTEIPESKTDKAALSGYISGVKLNVEASKVKFVFTVGSADEVKLSYVSASGKTVEENFTECSSGQELELSLRAYDLNTVITVTVGGGEAKGTYDLAAYAGEIKEKDNNAYALLAKMYNYAVSAKVYKFS